jgi:hypothetical protein
MRRSTLPTDPSLPPATPFENVTAESDGQWITALITIDTAEDVLDGNTFYGCASDDAISRSVCFKGSIDLNENVPHVVMGRLRVIYHATTIIDDERYEGFSEYRLERAVLVR